MEQILTWNKGTFDSNYQVFIDRLLKFSLSFNSFQNSAIATTKTGIFAFKNVGFWNGQTHIINNKSEVLAKIIYDSIGFKAKIVYANGEEFDWSFQNSWLSRWTINNRTDKQIIFSASSGNGIIHSNIDDDILVLSGLFIREYYARIIFTLIFILLFPILWRGIF